MDMPLLGCFNNLRLGVLLLVGAGNNGTEPINRGAHRLNIFLRPRELPLIAFTIEQAHRVLDRVRLLEELRDRLTEIVLIGSYGSHARYVGTKAIHFKILAVIRHYADDTAPGPVGI